MGGGIKKKKFVLGYTILTPSLITSLLLSTKIVVPQNLLIRQWEKEKEHQTTGRGMGGRPREERGGGKKGKGEGRL